MKTEAINRMRALGIYKPTIDQFQRSGILSRSEPPFGAIYWVEDEDLKAVKEFEQETGCLVYHVIRSFTTLGTMDAYLYVSPHKDEWEPEREDIEEGYPLAYVRNLSEPLFSDFGTIGIRRTGAAGLLRTE